MFRKEDVEHSKGLVDVVKDVQKRYSKEKVREEFDSFEGWKGLMRKIVASEETVCDISFLRTWIFRPTLTSLLSKHQHLMSLRPPSLPLPSTHLASSLTDYSLPSSEFNQLPFNPNETDGKSTLESSTVNSDLHRDSSSSLTLSQTGTDPSSSSLSLEAQPPPSLDTQSSISPARSDTGWMIRTLHNLMSAPLLQSPPLRSTDYPTINDIIRLDKIPFDPNETFHSTLFDEEDAETIVNSLTRCSLILLSIGFRRPYSAQPKEFLNKEGQIQAVKSITPSGVDDASSWAVNRARIAVIEGRPVGEGGRPPILYDAEKTRLVDEILELNDVGVYPTYYEISLMVKAISDERPSLIRRDVDPPSRSWLLQRLDDQEVYPPSLRINFDETSLLASQAPNDLYVNANFKAELTTMDPLPSKTKLSANLPKWLDKLESKIQRSLTIESTKASFANSGIFPVNMDAVCGTWSEGTGPAGSSRCFDITSKLLGSEEAQASWRADIARKARRSSDTDQSDVEMRDQARNTQPLSTPSPQALQPLSTPSPQALQPLSTPSPQALQPLSTPSPQALQPLSTPSPQALQPLSTPSPQAPQPSSCLLESSVGLGKKRRLVFDDESEGEEERLLWEKPQKQRRYETHLDISDFEHSVAGFNTHTCGTIRSGTKEEQTFLLWFWNRRFGLLSKTNTPSLIQELSTFDYDGFLTANLTEDELLIVSISFVNDVWTGRGYTQITRRWAKDFLLRFEHNQQVLARIRELHRTNPNHPFFDESSLFQIIRYATLLSFDHGIAFPEELARILLNDHEHINHLPPSLYLNHTSLNPKYRRSIFPIEVQFERQARSDPAAFLGTNPENMVQYSTQFLHTPLFGLHSLLVRGLFCSLSEEERSNLAVLLTLDNIQDTMTAESIGFLSLFPPPLIVRLIVIVLLETRKCSETRKCVC
ncbi:hypothetical protein BLNAU_17319 [Blattamonas nauphoetae]|uniref:Uncharacterized protein n=1 Tax=Blattamonas nauphoetae TaxID=2049346 RepID=A0ABQ9X7G3_9EUKA|nr:hypothetical protein BLNAU_17319 [Blattamonas nauphoetae]